MRPFNKFINLIWNTTYTYLYNKSGWTVSSFYYIWNHMWSCSGRFPVRTRWRPARRRAFWGRSSPPTLRMLRIRPFSPLPTDKPGNDPFRIKNCMDGTRLVKNTTHFISVVVTGPNHPSIYTARMATSIEEGRGKSIHFRLLKFTPGCIPRHSLMFMWL